MLKEVAVATCDGASADIAVSDWRAWIQAMRFCLVEA